MSTNSNRFQILQGGQSKNRPFLPEDAPAVDDFEYFQALAEQTEAQSHLRMINDLEAIGKETSPQPTDVHSHDIGKVALSEVKHLRLV